MGDPVTNVRLQIRIAHLLIVADGVAHRARATLIDMAIRGDPEALAALRRLAD